jgi:urease accessory protein
MVNGRLARLLQLTSPTLPVGTYSYSQGLEAAIEIKIVKDAASVLAWVAEGLELNMARLEGPLLIRLMDAWANGEVKRVTHWNEYFLATRESAELRAETVQMGYSLNRLLQVLESPTPTPFLQLQPIEEVAFPTAFACAATHWQIPPTDALLGYFWSWCENQVMAAIKALPLGQTQGQQILLALGERLETLVVQACQRQDEALGNILPAMAILSSQHETQYSRLFRS